jgi:hypothetical protein
MHENMHKNSFMLCFSSFHNSKDGEHFKSKFEIVQIDGK